MPDNYFNHRLAFRVLRKIAIVAHNYHDRESRTHLSNQSEICDGVRGKDVSLAPGSPPIPLPHRRSALFIKHGRTEISVIVARRTSSICQP